MSYQSKKFNRVDVQVSLLTALIVIISCYLVFYMNYRLSYDGMVEGLQSRAGNVHDYLESYLEDGQLFKLYTRGDEKTDIYQEAKGQLQGIRSAAGIRYLYTAAVNPEGTFIYGVDGLPEDSGDFRHVGDPIEAECIPDMERAMNGETVLPQKIASTSWGAVFIAYFPMHSEGRVVGVLGMEFDAQSQYEAYQSMFIWTPVVIILFCVAASGIAVKLFRYISNPSVQDMSNMDFLTGIKNRNAFEVALNNLDKSSEKKRTAVLSADMDRLKQVNDTYGHMAGDDYIRFGCQVLQSVLPGGALYRIGGDEFSALLTDCSETKVKELAQKAAEALEEERRKREGPLFANAGMSVGYAAYDPEQDVSLYDTLKRADRVMYGQKHETHRPHPYSE